MTKKILTALVAGALSVGPALYGQADDSTQKKGSQKQQADRPGQETLTGCLSEDQGTYKLATSTGDQVTVTGPADLMKHKGHTVRLTGTSSTDAGKKSLTVSKIEHVSPSCTQ